MKKIVIGLGANLGDRLATLREAVRRISLIAPVLERSRVFETRPVDAPPSSPSFLNAAVLVEWSADPTLLLDKLLAIEAELGRARTAGVRNEARPIDLDVLWIEGGTRVDDAPRLVVPHPRLHERAFAIAPLLDVAPNAPYAAALDHDDDEIRVIDASL